MKPYKIHNTWVDLDHVLAVDDTPTRPWGNMYIVGYATMMFLDKPICITLTYEEWNRSGISSEQYVEARKTWEDFKTAWMNKDKPDFGEFPPSADTP